ncbi:MAG: prepilin-type N-terminal cleavage/methylation domain-containing protein [Planctomycetota bacterium]
MKRRKNSGFSLLEVIAAVVILAVVAAATVATVAPMRAKSEDKLADQEVATLNAMAQTYFLEMGNYPADADGLASAGYLANRTAEERARLTKIKNNYNYSAATGVFRKKR